MSTTGPLTPGQVDQFNRDGFLVVNNLLSPAEIAAYIEHQSKPRPKEWNLGLQCHKADPMIKRLANHPNILSIVRQLVGGRARIVQSMPLDKAPAGGKGIPLHQDTHYLPCEPNTLMACWIAVTDTDAGNGGFCVVPASHKRGLHPTHWSQDPTQREEFETTYTMRDRAGKEWQVPMKRFEIDNLRQQDILPLTIPKGGGVFFHGMIIHGSFANPSPDRIRRAWAVHYVHEKTWLLRTDVQDAVMAEM
ncbi:MAG: phytanoyl-CoA dioxygenase family protein [Planctomycetes bacterium]|nr:phytanoyl-CoA dioxygenase family protein [Planctomycetota bacterium]